MHAKVFVIILNWNGKKDTLDCLSSLELSDYPKDLFSIVIVDNGSTDGSVPAIQSAFPGVDMLELHENKGFTGGNNIGAKLALKRGADYVFFLNNDTIVEHSTVTTLVEAFTRHPDAGVVSPKIYFTYQGRKAIWYAGGDIDWANMYGKHIGVNEEDRKQYDKEKETVFCTGCAMMVKRDVLEKVGLFDERFFAYYEDSDLSIRAEKARFTLWYVPSARLFHKNAASSGGTGSKLQDYFIPRNRLLFAWKHASWRAKLALLRESIRLIFTPRRDSVLDFFFHRFGKGSCRFV